MARVGHRERILVMLRSAGGFGVCGASFLANYMPTYSQRIGELIRDGWEIERTVCGLHQHDGHIARYTLISEPQGVAQ